MTTVDNIFRAAFHEAGHVVAALHYGLPLREVYIRHDGSGLTTYCRQFGRAEARVWTISAYAGPASEDLAFLYCKTVDAADMAAIERMLQRLGLDWDECRLGMLRFEAQILVQRFRPRIAAIAGGLIQHGRLTAAQIERIRW
jgi:hypothetical protein